jgi:phosphoglycolate phosphatase
MSDDLRLVIWDVDGTLVDSRRVIARAMDTAFEAVGLPAPGYETTRSIVGLSLDVACARLAPADYGDARIGRLVEEYKRAFIAQRAEPDFEEPLYDGALETLERLDAEGWLMAIATGKARRGLDFVFAHHPIEKYFVSAHTACQGEGKPHPRMVLEALDASGVRPEHAVVVGDTAHDMAMARNAGVRAAGVAWGFHEPHEIEAGGAHEVHHDFDALNRGLDAFRAGAHVRGAA